jgi:hypothetical protein
VFVDFVAIRACPRVDFRGVKSTSDFEMWRLEMAVAGAGLWPDLQSRESRQTQVVSIKTAILPSSF